MKLPPGARELSEYNTGPYAYIRSDGTLEVELWYPRTESNPSTVELGLTDVRAADSIRITYDFERDGWSILQASGWYRDQQFGDVMDWQEVSFIKAWARVPKDGEA